MGSRFAKCHCYSFLPERCKLPSAWPVAQLATSATCPLFRMGKFPNESRFHLGFFVAPNRTELSNPQLRQRTRARCWVNIFVAGVGHRIPWVFQKIRRKPIYPMVPVWYEIGGATSALLIHFRHLRCRSVENTKYIFCLSLFLGPSFPKNS